LFKGVENTMEQKLDIKISIKHTMMAHHVMNTVKLQKINVVEIQHT